MRFPTVGAEFRAGRLEPPAGPVSVVIDTDAANEIDDQFTLAWALLTPDLIDLEAVIAEPFSFAHHREPLLEAEALLASSAPLSTNDEPHLRDEHLVLEQYGPWLDRLRKAGTAVTDLRFTTPAEGMDLSRKEILRVFETAGADPTGLVFAGADRYMSGANSPVPSAGVDRLIELARAADGPLYVAAIGCITNVASALLIAPDIVNNIVVLWTSGYPSPDERSNRPSLNLVQDAHAARVILDSGVPFVYMPGYLIGQQLTLSQPEVQAWVRGTSPLGDLLADLYDNNPLHPMFGIEDHFARTWVIWDLIVLAWLIDPTLVPTVLRPTPSLAADLRWDLSEPEKRPLMREAIGVDRDGIFRDLFTKLTAP